MFGNCYFLPYSYCFGSTYTKIGTIQRRLAWPLRKDDTQIREAFHIFFPVYKHGTNLEQIGTIQRTNWNDTENIVERFPDNGVNNETCFFRRFLTITTYTSIIKSHCFNQEK